MEMQSTPGFLATTCPLISRQVSHILGLSFAWRSAICRCLQIILQQILPHVRKAFSAPPQDHARSALTSLVNYLYALQALYQPQGGIVNSEEGIRAHAQAAQQHGATLHCSEKVKRWRALPSGEVAVTTEKATYTANTLVLTAGAWMPELVPELQAGSPADSLLSSK